jgi:hypothetical protein
MSAIDDGEGSVDIFDFKKGQTDPIKRLKGSALKAA